MGGTVTTTAFPLIKKGKIKEFIFSFSVVSSSLFIFLGLNERTWIQKLSLFSCPVLTFYCTLYFVKCTLKSVKCKGYTVESGVKGVQRRVWSAKSTLNSVDC